MGRVSKRRISKTLHEEIKMQLEYMIGSLVNKSEIELFLSEFLTKEEKIMLGKRLILYMLLFKGFTNSEIYDILSVSHETVRLYKQLFDTKPESFKKQIQRLIQKERSQELWIKIEDILTPLTLALEAKTNMKARTKLLTGNY